MTRALPALAALLAAACLPPAWGANIILHPFRKPIVGRPGIPHEEVAFRSEGLRLRGWLFRGRPGGRGLVVYLHGVADNRQSGVWLARRLTALGFDVLAYDARAHGESEGEYCTYGVRERHDLRAALDAVKACEAALVGSSYGASVALQAAAVDPRVTGVVAQSPYADLPSIVADRAPFFATRGEVQRALALAGERGGFAPGEASAVAAAARLTVPVLLVHGARDRATPPIHSQRIHDALPGPRRLLLVPEAGHNDVLGRPAVWREVEEWLVEWARSPRRPCASPSSPPVSPPPPPA